MAALSTADVAISNANTVMSLVQQLKTLRAQIAELVNVNANNPVECIAYRVAER